MCWDMSEAEPWYLVKRRADELGELVHLGSFCELVYLKGSELDEGHPDRK